MRKPPERIPLGEITLRRHTLADLDALVLAVNENLGHLRPWMPWAQGGPRRREDQRPFLESSIAGWEAGNVFNYGIWSADESELRGGIGLIDRVGPGALEIGYWLARRHTGKGYARRSAQALTEAALALPGITRVEIHCDVANLRSAAIPKALGYRLDRIEEDGVMAPGEAGRGMVWIFEPRTPPAPEGS